MLILRVPGGTREQPCRGRNRACLRREKVQGIVSKEEIENKRRSSGPLRPGDIRSERWSTFARKSISNLSNRLPDQLRLSSTSNLVCLNQTVRPLITFQSAINQTFLKIRITYSFELHKLLELLKLLKLLKLNFSQKNDFQ